MRENGDFVKACEVFWGEWIEYDKCNLEEPTTPESLLIEKDTINSLPKECRLMADLILNLPEEMFLINGRLKKTFFRKFVKTKTGWPIEKVDRIQHKLEYHLAVATGQKF